MLIPEMHPSSSIANESSGVGRRESKRYTVIPFAARTLADISANNRELFRLSCAMATPLSAAFSCLMSSASPCVACATVYIFMREIPAPIMLRSPAVPNDIGAVNRATISFSLPSIDSSSLRREGSVTFSFHILYISNAFIQ